MNVNVGSTFGFTTVEIEAVRLGDRLPVMHAGPAERIGADAAARTADRVEVDDVAQVVTYGEMKSCCVRRRARLCRSYGSASRPRCSPRAARWRGPESTR